MSNRTELSQAMARQLVEMRTGKLEKGEEFGESAQSLIANLRMRMGTGMGT
jgi:hypothetical protein